METQVKKLIVLHHTAGFSKMSKKQMEGRAKRPPIKIRLDNITRFELMMRDCRFKKFHYFTTQPNRLFYIKDMEYLIEYDTINDKIRGCFLNSYEYPFENTAWLDFNSVILVDGVLMNDFDKQQEIIEAELYSKDESFSYNISVKNKGTQSRIVALFCPEQQFNHSDIEISDSGEMPIGLITKIRMVSTEKQFQNLIYYADTISDAVKNGKRIRNPQIVLERADGNSGAINISHESINPIGNIPIDKLETTAIVVFDVLQNQILLGKNFIYFPLIAGEKVDFKLVGNIMNIKYIQ